MQTQADIDLLYIVDICIVYRQIHKYSDVDKAVVNLAVNPRMSPNKSMIISADFPL